MKFWWFVLERFDFRQIILMCLVEFLAINWWFKLATLDFYRISCNGCMFQEPDFVLIRMFGSVIMDFLVLVYSTFSMYKRRVQRQRLIQSLSDANMVPSDFILPGIFSTTRCLGNLRFLRWIDQWSTFSLLGRFPSRQVRRTNDDWIRDLRLRNNARLDISLRKNCVFLPKSWWILVSQERQ